jgi:hypothetical protein
LAEWSNLVLAPSGTCNLSLLTVLFRQAKAPFRIEVEMRPRILCAVRLGED